MRRSTYTAVSTIGLTVLLLSASALAQQKYVFSHTTPAQSSRYLQQHIIDVEDMPGHQIRILEIERKYTKDHPMVAGVKVVAVIVRGFSDYTDGVGPAQGYEKWVLEDGNQIFAEWLGTSYTEKTSTGAREGTFNGTRYLIGGTGKFATIRGVLTEKSEFNTDPDNGYNNSFSQGQYWFVQ
jgi:hypothetical protein